MSSEDRELKSILAGLRQAPVPPAPHVQPRASVPSRFSLASLALAAVLLVALAAALRVSPPRRSDPVPAAASLRDRIDEVDGKIARLKIDPLKELLRREAELLRLELRLAEE